MATVADAAFYEVLEADLRALSSEARKTDSIATQITGWLQHTDFPQIKECAERALLRLRAIAQEGRGVEAVRTKEILRPFLLVCESKNPRLIGAVLGSIQKLLAHNAVSDEGRQQIIQALHQVERSSDDTVKLKILQTALTLLQNPSNADDQEGAGQVLSLCMRIYCHNKSSPTVVSTAAATVRQAVALLFDHAVMGTSNSGSNAGVDGVATGREIAAVMLLQDLLNMCAGSPATWLKCPSVGRSFVLDLLEFVLLHRPAAFQAHSAFKALLQTKMGPCLAELSVAALDPEVEPASAGEAKLLLRCVGAMLRKHALLLPELAPKMIETLLAGCGASRMPWQRLLSLQVLRWLMSDPQLLYALFSAYDMSIHHDVNAVHDTLQVALEIVKAYVKQADASEDDLMERLSSIYKGRADGKELQIDVDSAVVVAAATQEAWVAYLALDMLLSVVACVETLADAVASTNGSACSEQLQLAPLATATSGMERSSSNSSSSLLSIGRQQQQQQQGQPPLAAATVSTLVDVLWRPLLAGLSSVLGRCYDGSRHEALMLQVLQAYQRYTYSAGALGEVHARDAFLAALCEVAVTPVAAAEEAAAAAGKVAGRVSLDGAQAGRTSIAASFLSDDQLADSLGPSWVLVVEVLCTLDRLLPAAGGPGSSKHDDRPSSVLNELLILLGIANQLFESSADMTPDAQVSLMLALSEVSSRTLAAAAQQGFQSMPAGGAAGGLAAAGAATGAAAGSGGAGGGFRLSALNRMVEVLLYNLPRIQDLWGIFLAHLMEVLHSGNAAVRAAAIEALDKSLTGAIGSPCLGQQQQQQLAPAAAAAAAAAAEASQHQPGASKHLLPPRGTAAAAAAAGSDVTAASQQQQQQQQGSSSTAGDVEHMLLVALESMYKEEREPDVRLGLLRVTLHVLQRHGECLSRGWVPLLRLLEAVPAWEEASTVAAAFQCVESVSSDFLPTMPKQHLERALEVAYLFVAQKKISVDPRPEVRNSGVRTLFLAVGSQASRFDAQTLRYCLWEILFPLVTYVHVVGDTSSSAEAAAVELGKDKGKAVMMLMHHSRNSEQKQWDETTVLALNGLGKVLKAHMATVLTLPGFDEKWDEVCAIAARVLCCGRKAVAVAAAQLLTGFLQLLTGFLQSYKPVQAAAAAASGAAAAGYGVPWKRALAATDEAVIAMSVHNTRVPLQARSELLTGLAAVLASQGPEGAFDHADMQLLLKWMDGLARHPTGADDVTPVPGVLPPVQKLVLQILGHFNTVVVPEAWTDVLLTLAGFLCPFKAMQQRQAQDAAAAAAGAPAAADAAAAHAPAAVGAATAAGAAKLAPGSPGGLFRGLARLASGRPSATAAAAAAAAAAPSDDAAALSFQWMGKIVERLVSLYSHAPWQVRASLFAPVVSGLGQCAALRHVAPEEPLWQQAAAGLVSVVNAGLPAVNIMFVNHHQPPENAWQVLAGTFEMFLLGWGLPDSLRAQAAEVAAAAAAKQQQQQQATGGSSGSSSSRRPSGTGSDTAAAESKLHAAVLDSFTDVVVASCF
ncbi:hypothetical protein OEZ86_009826 [Tetradesmus obliquus]|nr:hypothetical protein OEZ86_009826 [Tetradesmus obliquus]